MKQRVVAISDLTAADISAWRDLARDAMEPNPLFEAECLLPAAELLPDGSSMHLVIAEDAGIFYGCFPVTELRGGIPPRLRVRLLSRPAVTTLVRRLQYDGTPLLRAERSVEAARALLAAFRGPTAVGRPRFLVFQTMDTDGPVAASLQMALSEMGLASHALKEWTRPVVRRVDGDDLAESNRRKLAKLTRKMSEECHEVVAVRDVSSDPSMIPLLVAMEDAGYKAKNDVAMSVHPGELEWFEGMCARFREQGRLALYALYVGDKIVALQLMLRSGDCLFGLQSVYDESYARFSPGIILHRSFIERFYTSPDLKMKDTCTFEGNATLLRLYPHLRSVATLVVVVGGAYDRLLLWGFAAMQKAIQPDSALHSRFPRVHGALVKVVSRGGLKPI